MILPTVPTPRPAADAKNAFSRLALVSLACGVAMGAIGWVPTVALGGPEAASAMLMGISAALLGGWVGIGIPTALLRRPPHVVAWGAIAGLGARFLVTLALALIIRQTGAVANKPFLVWVGVAQFVILAVDMLGLIWLVRTHRPVETA